MMVVSNAQCRTTTWLATITILRCSLQGLHFGRVEVPGVPLHVHHQRGGPRIAREHLYGWVYVRNSQVAVPLHHEDSASNPPDEYHPQWDHHIISFNGDAGAPMSFCTVDLQAFWRVDIWMLVDQITDMQHLLRDGNVQYSSKVKASLRQLSFDYSRSLISSTAVRPVNELLLLMDILNNHHDQLTLLDKRQLGVVDGRRRLEVLASFQNSTNPEGNLRLR